MARVDLTVRIFAGYLVLVSAALLTIPSFLIQLFGLPTTSDVWPRIIGMLVLALALYYWDAGRRSDAGFVRATLYGRLLVFAGLVVFVVLGMSRAILLLFMLVDLAFMAWSGYELRRAGIDLALTASTPPSPMAGAQEA